MSANLSECEQLRKHSFLEITTTKLNGFNLANDLVQNINDVAEHLVNTGYSEFNDIVYLGDDISDFDLVFELRTKFVTSRCHSLNQFRSNSMIQLTGYLTPDQAKELKESDLWSVQVYSTYVLKPDYYKGKHAK
jgi:DNA repair protein RadC